MPRLATCLLCISLPAATSTGRADDAHPVPRFTDPDRISKLESALPDIDRLFRAYAASNRIPGMVWGVVIDDRLAHLATAGVRELSTRSPIEPTTVFRIASMTKSFTALAVLKLRDAHRLSLEDPVSKWLPEWSPMNLPTLDTAPLRIRDLLCHSAGLPEDNPWGDQQLAASDADLTRWLRRGIPFSNPPDTRYEYSNYAYALLGRIITRASGVPYERYIRREILAPLHMDASTFEFADVPAADRAIGYRLQPDGSSYREEPPLPHGAFGAMGGLLTSAAARLKRSRHRSESVAKPARCGPRTGCAASSISHVRTDRWASSSPSHRRSRLRCSTCTSSASTRLMSASRRRPDQPQASAALCRANGGSVAQSGDGLPFARYCVVVRGPRTLV